MLNTNQIAEIFSRAENKVNLDKAVSQRINHERHVVGTKHLVDRFINTIQGVENEEATKVRESLVEPYTVSKMAAVRRPKEKVFSATGGSSVYKFRTKEEANKKRFLEILLSKGDRSPRKWLRTVWNDKVDFDANGLCFIEVSKDGKDAYATYKSVDCIYSYALTEKGDFDYIILKHGKANIGRHEHTVYRLITSEYDYLFTANTDRGNKVKISLYGDKPIINNKFGYVPAVFLSTRNDASYPIKTTWIYESLVPADDLLLDYSNYKVYKVKLAIPMFWMYGQTCPVCHGEPESIDGGCSTCNNTGYKIDRNASDSVLLAEPSEGEATITPPAGFVQPDLKTLEKLEETMDMLAVQMTTAVWGQMSEVDKSRQNATAFEISVRADGQTDRLNLISDNAEKIQEFITNAYGAFHFGDEYIGCTINLGRSYNNRTQTEIWSEYEEALNKKASTTILNEILTRYYQSKYEYDPVRQADALNKMKTKPFFHLNTDQINSFQFLPLIDRMKNIYYDDFVVDFEKKNKIAFSKIEDIQNALNDYIKTKMSETDIESTNSKTNENE